MTSGTAVHRRLSFAEAEIEDGWQARARQTSNAARRVAPIRESVGRDRHAIQPVPIPRSTTGPRSAAPPST
jgi:hypothetical protein